MHTDVAGDGGPAALFRLYGKLARLDVCVCWDGQGGGREDSEQQKGFGPEHGSGVGFLFWGYVWN